MAAPLLSIVILTLDEEANVAACLNALALQDHAGFEVLVVDAGSTDRTVDVVRQQRRFLPFPVRLHVGPARMPIGAARNLGVALSRAPRVAFVSADAELEPGWVAQALRVLADADMAFGPQVHAPRRWSVAAAVRGLRYAFPHGPTPHPLRYASNVAAAYRRAVLRRFPFPPGANAAEDLLLARRAHAAGHSVRYDPAMVARHSDVSTLRQELRKAVREGDGRGRHAGELGVQWPVLAWAGMLGAGLAVTVARPRWGLPALAAALWLPAVRRAVRHRSDMPPGRLAAGVAATPPFDVVYVGQYVRGLARGWLAARRRARPTRRASRTFASRTIGRRAAVGLAARGVAGAALEERGTGSRRPSRPRGGRPGAWPRRRSRSARPGRQVRHPRSRAVEGRPGKAGIRPRG